MNNYRDICKLMTSGVISVKFIPAASGNVLPADLHQDRTCDLWFGWDVGIHDLIVGDYYIQGTLTFNKTVHTLCRVSFESMLVITQNSKVMWSRDPAILKQYGILPVAPPPLTGDKKQAPTKRKSQWKKVLPVGWRVVKGGKQ